MKKVDIKSIVIPNRSRSGNYPTGSTVTPSGGGSNSTIINQGGGIDLTQARKEFLSKKTSDEAKGIINFLKGIKIAGRNISNLLPKNSEEEITDEAIMSAARVILEIGNAIGKLDNKFLRKDQSDSTNFLLQLLGGAEFGKYASGISGGKIDEQGAAELLSLLLRSALTIGEYKKGLKGAKIDEEGVADLLSILVRSGIESANFSTGALGAGFCLKKDENGDSYLEVDRMLVRKVATFIQLLIQQIKHVGGQIILTPASMSCVKVEDKGDYYRCYFENTDGERTIEQEFVVGDLARAQTFNVKEGVNENVTNSYYWRAVVGTGDNYIDLSKTDCDAGSTEPKAGDDIVQLGNKSDATRQAAIILSAYGNDAPYFKLYRGINSYSLNGKEFVSFSRSEVMIIADTIRFSSGETIEEYINNVTGDLVVDVEAAKEAASQASEDASKAVERLDKWSEDGVISPTEKQSLKDEISRIDADKTQVSNGYAKYNLGTPTDYNNAHTAYRAVLVTLTASTPETISIPSDFTTKQTAYYTQRTNSLTAISDAARDYAETISNDLTSYKKTVTSQFEQTNNSITAAVTSSKEYTDSAVSGIQIGGINLCLDSNKENEPLQGISPTSGYKILNVDTSIKQGEVLESERYYTLSIWYKSYNDSDPNKPFTSFPIGQAPGGDGWSLRFWKSNGTVINEGEYYKWTGTIKAKVGTKLRANPYVGFILEDSSQKTGMSLYKYKLEEGNKPTAWSPAPEDINTSIESVSSRVEVVEGEVALKIDREDFNNLEKRVSNTEVAVQPENIWIGISSKVTTTSKVNNIVPDSCFDDANYSILYSGGQRIQKDSASSGCPTNYCMKSTASIVYANNGVSVALGEKYYISAVVNASQSNYEVLVGLMLKSNTGSYSYLPIKGVAAKISGWQTISGYVTIPNNILDARIYFKINGSSSLGTAYFTKVYAYRVDSNRNNLALNSKGPWTANKYQLITYLTFVEPLKSGTIYTVSWKGSGTGRLAVYFSNGAASATRQGVTNGIPITANNNYQGITFYSEHFKLDPELETDNGINLTVKEAKVEEGERATDWCYSDGDYSTTEQIKTGITVKENAISIFGKDVSLQGKITFSSLNSSLQSTINNKADSGDVTSDINSSKEDMAKKLGYASYADMVSAATAGNTIIEGGHIRTSLIEADALVVKTLNAANTDGVSTLVNKDGMKMTQGSNVLFKLTSNKATAGTTRYYAQMDLTTVYSDGSTLQGTLTPESLFLRGKTKSTDKTLKTTLMYNGLMIYDENGTGLTVNTKGVQLTYCGKTQGGSNVCSVVHYAKCIFSAYITASGYLGSSIGGSIPNSSGTPIEFSITRTGAGRYKVTHNINDTKYFGQITALSNGSLTVGIFENRNSTSFDYSTISFDGNGWYAKDCGVYLSIYYESPMLFTF